MHRRNTANHGFTIVELLIVVVVIAILAAITIVAYTNFQNRAYHSAVKNDMANFAKKVQLIAAESGELPIGARIVASDGTGTGSHSGPPAPAPKLSVSKSAYPHVIGGGVANFIYCEGVGIQSGQSEWAAVAQAKSGIIFRYSSILGLEEGIVSSFSTGVGPGDCVNVGLDSARPYSFSYGYWSNAGGWQPWLK